MKIIISESAQNDLKGIQEYIYDNNPKAAKIVSLYIIDRIQTLLPPNPAIGRLTGVLRTRELVLTRYPYKIPYRVVGDELHILRVLHTSQKWEE